MKNALAGLVALVFTGLVCTSIITVFSGSTTPTHNFSDYLFLVQKGDVNA